MKARLHKPFIWLGTLILLVSLACNIGGGGDRPAPTEAPAVTQEAVTTEPATEEPVATDEPATVEPASSGAVTSLDELEKAVVNIEVEGSYQDPFEGWMINLPRGGTGFIIDPSGLAITNNHVVTGAAQLKVYIGGERPRARVLGSECSDLAVIDIDGDGFAYLDWFPGEISLAWMCLPLVIHQARQA
jgi:S1-C subfamily serine protease